MATNNYVRIHRGTESQMIFFDDRDPDSVRAAADKVGRLLSHFGTTLGAVSRGRSGLVEAVVLRPCSSLPLPVVGSVRAPLR